MVQAVALSCCLGFCSTRPDLFAFVCTSSPLNDGCICCSRLLHSSHVGVEDGPGGARGTSESQNPQSVADHDGKQCDVDSGSLTVVHLSLHWRLTGGGECIHVSCCNQMGNPAIVTVIYLFYFVLWLVFVVRLLLKMNSRSSGQSEVIVVHLIQHTGAKIILNTIVWLKCGRTFSNNQSTVEEHSARAALSGFRLQGCFLIQPFSSHLEWPSFHILVESGLCWPGEGSERLFIFQMLLVPQSQGVTLIHGQAISCRLHSHQLQVLKPTSVI